MTLTEMAIKAKELGVSYGELALQMGAEEAPIENVQDPPERKDLPDLRKEVRDISWKQEVLFRRVPNRRAGHQCKKKNLTKLRNLIFFLV